MGMYILCCHTWSGSKQAVAQQHLAVQPAGFECAWAVGPAASVCHTMLLRLIWGLKLLLILRDLPIISCSWSSNAQFLPATAATSRAEAELSKGLL